MSSPPLVVEMTVEWMQHERQRGGRHGYSRGRLGNRLPEGADSCYHDVAMATRREVLECDLTLGAFSLCVSSQMNGSEGELEYEEITLERVRTHTNTHTHMCLVHIWTVCVWTSSPVD